MTDVREALENCTEVLENVLSLGIARGCAAPYPRISAVYQMREVVEQARAALAGDGWRDMESAPRDSEAVILYGNLFWAPFGKFHDLGTDVVCGYFRNDRWYIEHTHHEVKPKCWQPKPPPPAGDK